MRVRHQEKLPNSEGSRGLEWIARGVVDSHCWRLLKNKHPSEMIYIDS